MRRHGGGAVNGDLAICAPAGRRRPRVMIVTTMPSTVDVFLTEQIQGLREAGFEVTVVCSPDNRLGRLRESGIRLLPMTIPRSLRPVPLAIALVRLVWLFGSRRPDVVHTHTPIAAFLGQLAAWLARVPARITTVHGLYFVGERRRVPRLLFRILELTTCRLATKVICVSDVDTRYLVERRRFAASRVDTMHVGVNMEAYSSRSVGEAARQEVRREMGIPDDAFVFGTVARLVREKGLEELFEAFGRLIRRHENIYLLHVGPEDRTRADAIDSGVAGHYGCEANCRFAGHRYDVARFLAAMDLFCLPTYREGYPVSIMEAAAMGLPCIVSDVRGCREAVIDGQTGLIVPVRDVAALESAMERLLGSPEKRAALADGAMRRALDQFDRRLVVQRTVRLYQAELQG